MNFKEDLIKDLEYNDVFLSLSPYQRMTIAEIAEKQLLIQRVSVSFDEGYEKGWREATTEACTEIAKNYQPNER